MIDNETLQMLNSTKDDVVYLTRKFPKARKNYNYLIAFYIKEFLGIDLSQEEISKIGNATAFETITRIRRYLKNELRIYAEPIDETDYYVEREQKMKETFGQKLLDVKKEDFDK